MLDFLKTLPNRKRFFVYGVLKKLCFIQPIFYIRIEPSIRFMRQTFCLLLSTAVLFFASCQREADGVLPNGNPPDSTNTTDTTTTLSHNLIREINIKGLSSFSEKVNATFTIQYDTPGSKITVLVRDSIPDDSVFDAAAKGVVYQFNRSGYLTSSTILNKDDTQRPEFSIVRNAANEIEKIIEYDVEEIAGMPYNDTLFYRYASGIIEDSTRSLPYPGSTTSYFNRQVRTYDAQNRLQTMTSYSQNTVYDTKRFTYDAQNNISRLAAQTYTIDYTYATQKDTGWKNLPQLFLGKDAPVLMKELYNDFGYTFLTFIIESKFETIYNPLLTQPLASLHITGESVFGSNDSQTVTFTTTYTTENKIKTITATPADGGQITYTFSY